MRDELEWANKERLDGAGQLLVSFLRPRAPKKRQYFNPALTNAKELSIFIASKNLTSELVVLGTTEEKRKSVHSPERHKSFV